MKKRTLFSLLTATLLMVGCQQDELATLDKEASIDLSNRPVLGAVSLVTDDPSTRLAIGGNGYSSTFVDGDKLGAMIVDMPNSTSVSATKSGYTSVNWTYSEYVKGVKKDKNGTVNGTNGTALTAVEAGVDISSFYTLNTGSEISSNYPYIRESGAWYTQANLVEGNYVFYAPYNAAHMTRQPLVITLPVVQDCSESDKALKDFYNGTDPVYIAHSFLQAPSDPSEAIKPSVKYTNIFAYPQITIRNSYNGFLFNGGDYSTTTTKTYDMTIKTIEIYDSENENHLDYKRALDVTAYTTTLKDYDWDKTKKDDGVTGIFTTGATDSIFGKNPSGSPYYVGSPNSETAPSTYATMYVDGANDVISTYQQKRVTLNVNKTIKYGEEYEFFAVMPAEDYGNGLYAKITVEIDGETYMILHSASGLTQVAERNSSNYGRLEKPTEALDDWNFRDTKHGDQGVRLVRGQRFPAAEVLEDASDVKSFAGTLMTISLTGGEKQVAVQMNRDNTNHYGVESNTDFIDRLKKEIQRGVSLTEKSAVETTKRENWGASDIAFKSGNTVTINAELVRALYSYLYDNRGGSITGDVLSLNTTRLPIADDVIVTASERTATTGYTAYTFTTVEDGVSYDIEFTSDLVSTDGAALINGINTVSEAATLTCATGTTGAVVFVTGGTATLNAAGKITGINVGNNGTLAVNCSTPALICNEGNITMGENGAMTNDNNVLAGTIDNSTLRSIAGTVETGGVVKLRQQGWPSAVIAASTKINTIELTQTAEMNIEQEQVAKLANLKNVNITLTAATSIVSAADVTLTNINSMAATNACTWSLTHDSSASGITIHCGKDNGTEFFTSINAGDYVTFAK